MFQHIYDRLFKNGYQPSLIIDIGAHKGSWTRNMLNIYPNAMYMLFDATYYQEIDSLQGMHNIIFYDELLSNKEETVDWYEINGTGDSMFKERTFHYQNIEPKKRQTKTLNEFFSDMTSFNNILLKIDCQGAELPILEGADKFYNNIDFIVLELPFFGQYNENVPSFAEHIAFMDKIGFVVFEFLESHVVNNFNIQVDLLFIRKNHPFHQKLQDSLMTRFQEQH